MNYKNKVELRLEELETELERFIIQANNQVSIYKGVIAELEKLLDKKGVNENAQGDKEKG